MISLRKPLTRKLVTRPAPEKGARSPTQGLHAGLPSPHLRHRETPKSFALDAYTIRIYNMPVITWDQRKRRLNLTKHGLDFVDAEGVFLGLT
jgi:hypothetical protein